MQELPKYRCHKVVGAAKISTAEIKPDGSCRIYFDEPELGSFLTGPGWSRQYKGTLEDKGYYVRYEDGYESWSPSKAFEDGYIRSEDGPLLPASPKPSPQKPAIGRIVHYQSYGTPGEEYTSQPRAAVITAVGPNTATDQVSLCILNPTGMFFTESVHFSPEPKPGYWSWPPRT